MIRTLLTAALLALPALAGDTVAPVPEPSTLLLMGVGMAGLGLLAHRRNRGK